MTHVKKYIHLYMYSKLEYEELKDIFDGNLKNFNSKFAKYIKTGDPVNDTIPEKTAKNDNIKKLYRKISKKLHPDKNLMNENSKEEFIKLQNAYQEDNLIELILIAEENKIEIDDEIIGDPENIEIIKDNIISFEKKINHIKNSFAWIYYNGSILQRDCLFNKLKEIWDLSKEEYEEV